jgi:hypothetical protein
MYVTNPVLYSSHNHVFIHVTIYISYTYFVHMYRSLYIYVLYLWKLNDAAAITSAAPMTIEKVVILLVENYDYFIKSTRSYLVESAPSGLAVLIET